jgi:beta-galactosidase
MNADTLPRIVAAILLAWPIAVQAAQPAPADFFPAAVWYGGGKARAPMMCPLNSGSAAEWGKDLDQIKAVGFNTVKCWVDWATAEPKPGVFDFKNLDLLMKLADERGLRVIIQIYLDSAPDWVGQRFPEGRFVDRSGAIVTSQSAPGYCIDHGGVRREIVTFLDALSRDANRSGSLYGWDVWSEPHVINWADFSWLAQPEFCFCPGSQGRFRQWLRTKYKTLDALNTAWYRKFESWEQVEAPRFSTILSYTDYMDWRAFIDDKLAGDLKTRTDAIRAADRTHAITSHAAAPGLFTSPTDGYGEPDDWKMSGAADFFGTSIYPKHSESAHPWTYWMLAAGLDFARSAGHAFGKGFWIGELQAGQGATGMRIVDPVTAHDEEFWMWQVVAHGAQEIANYAWYPMSSGFESNGYGLINLDGTLTDRARAAGRVASIIGRNAREINQAQPAPAEVAILYNRLSYMVGGSQPSPSTLGNAERDSLLGLYRVFFETQIPVDFVHPMSLDADHLLQYKLLFLPYPVMLPRRVTDVLKEYVKQGGTVVAEARLGWNDERGYASPVVPGFGLDELFGAREIMIRPEAEPKLSMSTGLAGMAGQTIAGAAFEEHLEALAGTQVLATFSSGDAAIVEKSYGQGKAILAGTFLGLAYQRKHDPSTRSLLLALAQEAFPQTRFIAAPEVEVRELTGDRYRFVFVFNHGDDKGDFKLARSLPWRPRAARDLVTGEDLPMGHEDARAYDIVLQRPLPRDAIWAIKLERD